MPMLVTCQCAVFMSDKFVIGHEYGTLTGYEHWQCKAHFRKPMTFEELSKYIGEWHREPSIVKDFSYCEKEGDYYRAWEGALAKFHDLKLLPWQEQVMDDLAHQNERQCTVILDRYGANGKSWLSKHLVVKYDGTLTFILVRQVVHYLLLPWQ
nr:MAG: rep protein [Cressdnaviricota sp.]